MAALGDTKAFLIFALAVSSCTPSRDSVLKDVERNYTASGFLDTETFQIQCTLDTKWAERESHCRKKLIEDLVSYKAGYDHATYLKRMHGDFQPFVKPAEVSETVRSQRREKFSALCDDHARIVLEYRSGDITHAVYRLRAKNLIYRVQSSS